MTYAPPQLSTNREVFAFVKAHLLRQNERSVTGDQACVYRSTLGCMCAVGCLISDEDYNTRIEGHSARDESVQIRIKSSIGFSPNAGMLNWLQVMHDTVAVSQWAEELEKINVPD